MYKNKNFDYVRLKEKDHDCKLELKNINHVLADNNSGLPIHFDENTGQPTNKLSFYQ